MSESGEEPESNNMKQEPLLVTVSEHVDDALISREDSSLSNDPKFNDSLISRKDSLLSIDPKSSSPMTFRRSSNVSSLAKAFRKVFRSRTPSPSTEEKDEAHHFRSNEDSKNEYLSCEFESQESFIVNSSSTGFEENGTCDTDVFHQSFTHESSNTTGSCEEMRRESVLSKDLLQAHGSSMSKSQTYSALSEALHHAFLEGMVCTGAEDVDLVPLEDPVVQESRSDHNFVRGKLKRQRSKKTRPLESVSSEDFDGSRRIDESEYSSHSLLVPSFSNRSGTLSDHSDICSDEDSSSQNSLDEKQCERRPGHSPRITSKNSPPDHDHKSFDLFGNFFNPSRRGSMNPQTSEESKTDSLKLSDSPHHKLLEEKDSTRSDSSKRHKSLGETFSKVAEYLQRGGSRLAEQQRRLKCQIWSSVVTIVLVEGKNLLPMDPDGASDPYVKFRRGTVKNRTYSSLSVDSEGGDPYVKFRLGNEKYKSKVELHTLNPKWLEQFDLHLFEDQSQNLEITVWDKDIRRDDFIGKCTIDLSQYEREMTHHVSVDLDKGAGSLFLLLTISGTTSSETISDLHNFQDNPKEVKTVVDRYVYRRTFHNLRDIGTLQVKVFRAQGLAAADLGGKSDPFCVLELVNARLQTQTEYKTLTPTWNKIFTFNVKDIHSILDITVYDEDRDHKVEFLGKVAIPLLKIKNGEKHWYALKDKKLRLRAKGSNPEILLELAVLWNPARAAIRTFTPMEEKYMQIEQKFKRQVFIRNVNRLKSSIMDFYELGMFIKSCWEWESPIRSSIAFVVFMVGTYCFEIYMLPIILLLVFLRNYIVISIVGSMMHREEENDLSGDEDDIDDDEKDKSGSLEEEKKTLKERLQVIQEVTLTVQNAIGYIASVLESCKNTFNFSVPFLSWLLIVVLIVGTVVLYYIPVRYLVMIWGISKFSRKLIRPHSIVNNEVLDFLSRVPDDEMLFLYRIPRRSARRRVASFRQEIQS